MSGDSPRIRILSVDNHGKFHFVQVNPAAKMRRANRRRSVVTAACILLVCRADTFALNPSLDVGQYAHTSWKTSEGFSEGLIRAIDRRPMGISGWVPNLACDGSMA